MREGEQREAVRLAFLLLIGGTLVLDAIIGPWLTLGLAVAIVAVVSGAPRLRREVQHRRFLRQLRRWR